MTTPSSQRTPGRTRKTINYNDDTPESLKLSKPSRKSVPAEFQENVRKSVRKSMHRGDNIEEDPTHAKTPKKSEKSSRKASEEPIEFSPKKLRANRTPSSKGLESIVQENSPSIEKLEAPNSRRSVRGKKPTERYSDINLTINLKNKTATPSKQKAKDECDDSVVEVSDSDDDTLETIILAKPSTLFVDSEDVDGQQLYSLKTPKKKDSMAVLAQATPKTPQYNHLERTPKTPKNSKLSEIQNTPKSRPSASKLGKTPRHIREATKKNIKKYCAFESEGDFSPDEDEYNPNNSSSSEESSDEDNEQENETPPKKYLTVAARVLKTPATSLVSATPSNRRSARNKGDFQYVLQSDDYFTSAASKTKTSDHTMDRLKNPRLPHDQLVKLLANMQLSKGHQNAVKGLNEEYKTYFNKWLTLFDEGYTVLLHGLGSKRNLLQTFHKERLAEEHVIVVNGFFPSLTIKDILDSIWVDLLEKSVVGGNPHEVVNKIEEEMKRIPALHIFLMVHNIDGPMLRNDKSQSVLSRLASIKNLHMIASIDHINTPLLWNNTKLSNFNFVWFDVTSFLPYTDETAFENSLLVQSSGALELSSMRSVFLSLTSNARGIYIVVVKYQLKNSGTPYYKGMSFKELYEMCRGAFLVSSDVALRAQLTEFLDHKLAKMKRTNDGTENITIPIRNALLEQFLNEQS